MACGGLCGRGGWEPFRQASNAAGYGIGYLQASAAVGEQEGLCSVSMRSRMALVTFN